MRKRFLTISLVPFFIFAILGFSACFRARETSNTNNAPPPQPENTPPPKNRFPSFRDEYAPPDWCNTENQNNPAKYPIFELIQDYPQNTAERPAKVFAQDSYYALL